MPPPSNKYGTPQTAAEREQALLGDYEFGIAVDNRLGRPENARDFIDPSRVKVVGKPEHSSGRAAWYQPPGYAEAAEATAMLTANERLAEGQKIEEDMIHLLASNDAGLTLDTVAHEFLHRLNEVEGKDHTAMNHHVLYAEVYKTATNKTEKEDAIKAYHHYLSQRTSEELTKDKTEGFLKKLVEIWDDQGAPSPRRGLLDT